MAINLYVIENIEYKTTKTKHLPNFYRTHQRKRNSIPTEKTVGFMGTSSFHRKVGSFYKLVPWLVNSSTGNFFIGSSLFP